MQTDDGTTRYSPAAFHARLIAKLVDIAIVAAIVVPLAWIAVGQIGVVVLGVSIPAGLVSLVLYTAVSEWRAGGTVGKRLMGLRVVSERGGRISLGQAFARQLPLLTDNVGVDALSALVTREHQRVYERASRTRVVVAA